MEEKLLCSHCGALIEDDDYSLVNGEVVCSDCVDNYCCTCNNCGSVIYDSDSHGMNMLISVVTVMIISIPIAVIVIP